MTERSDNPFQSPQAVDSDAALPEVGPPYVFEGTGSVDEYIAGWQLRNNLPRRSVNRFVAMVALALGLALAALIIYDHWIRANPIEYRPVFFSALLIVFGLFGRSLWRWRVRRWLRRMSAAFPNERVVIEQDSIKAGSDVGQTEIKWEGLQGYRSSPSQLILFISYPSPSLMLHRSCLKTLDAWPSLLRFVAERLPRK